MPRQFERMLLHCVLLIYCTFSRCPAASMSCRTAASPGRRSGREPRTFRRRSSEPSSTPCPPVLSVRSKGPPNRRRSSGGPALWDERLTAHVADERVRRAVVDRRRPVLLDGCVRRHGEAIGACAVERLAILVLDRSSDRTGRRPRCLALMKAKEYASPRHRPDSVRLGEERSPSLSTTSGEPATPSGWPS